MITNMAVSSVLIELYTSPKPGLVDKLNSGAHKDMDYFTFIRSSSSLWPYFKSFIQYGRNLEIIDASKLEHLRKIGLEAEKSMFEETKGINTHKGAIFTFAVFLCVIGYLEKNYDKKNINPKLLSESIKRLCSDISNDDFKNLNEKDTLSHGEKIFIKYNAKGIRGEAELGYPTVIDLSLPYMEMLIKSKQSSKTKGVFLSKVYVNTLLKIMSSLQDTNILYRHDMITLEKVKRDSNIALELGGMFTDLGVEFIYELDEEYSNKRISPGGAADLLGITVFCYHYFFDDSEILF